MKVCRKCGKDFKDAYSYCPKCGTMYDSKKEKNNVSMFSVLGFAFTILGVMTCGVLAPVGLILSIIGTIKSKGYGKTSFFGMIGIIFSGLMSFMWLILIIISIIGRVTAKDVTVIDFSTKTYKEAEDYCVKLYSGCIVYEEKSESVEKGGFIRQSKDPGVITKSYDYVKVYYSSGLKTKKSKKNKEENKSSEEILSYSLKYNELGSYGKKVEYEGTDEIFYYYPIGNYQIKLVNKIDSNCFLWVDYNNGYKNEYGTSYNNKEKLSFNKIGDKNDLIITDDVHIYNSNNCSYELVKIEK